MGGVRRAFSPVGCAFRAARGAFRAARSGRREQGNWLVHGRPSRGLPAPKRCACAKGRMQVASGDCDSRGTPIPNAQRSTPNAAGRRPEHYAVLIGRCQSRLPPARGRRRAIVLCAVVKSADTLSILRGVLEVQLQQRRQQVVVGHRGGPGVGGEDGFVEFFLGQIEPGGAVVVEVGERALFDLSRGNILLCNDCTSEEKALSPAFGLYRCLSLNPGRCFRVDLGG